MTEVIQLLGTDKDIHQMENKTYHKENIEKDKNGKEKSIDIDTILQEEIGQFGVYQIKSLLLALVLIVFAAWVANEYIFTTARINTRCLIPECENIDATEFSPSWILNAIPADRTGTTFVNCQRYANNTGINNNNGTCPANIFDQETEIDCESYVYENTNTVAYDFNLACMEWRRSFIGTFRTCGTLVGLPLTGFVSDRWGRKVALTLNAFNSGWIGLVRYWANSYTSFVILEFMESALGAGGFSCAYILVIELVGPKYRVAAGAIMNTFFALGQVTLGLIAMAVPNWRNLVLTLYIPQLLTISYFWIISESVRWYLSKGRYEEAEKVLKEVARVNKKVLSEKSIKLLKINTEEEKKKKLEAAEEEEWLVKLVFRTKPILVRCLISPIWWVTTTFIYYGMSVNSVTMTGNQYLNYVAVAAIEIPGFWTSYFLIGKIGRKPVLIGAFWICAACQFGYIFLSEGYYALSLTIYLIGKYSIAMVMTAIYVYTNELYPTKYRHRLFAFSSMVGRIGAISAPLTQALGDTVWIHLPSTLFGSFALLSGCLIFITPETLGSKLPDTMEEATNIGNKPTKTSLN